MKVRLAMLSAVMTAVTAAAPPVARTVPNRSPVASQSRIVESYGRLPLNFAPNRGQTDARVQFLSRGSGYGLFLTSTEAVLSLAASRGVSPQVLRMKLAGANRRSQARGLEPLAGQSNYFIGNDPQRWRTEIPHYARVEFAEVYPGVSLIYYGQQRQPEYDLVVAAGAKPERIRLRIQGASGLRIDGEGDLVLETAGGELRQKRPRIYQVVDGMRREVAGSYVLRGKQEVGFKLEDYDRRRAVVIDPVLVYSTYLGGSGGDWGRSIAVDGVGNAYIAGA